MATIHLEHTATHHHDVTIIPGQLDATVVCVFDGDPGNDDTINVTDIDIDGPTFNCPACGDLLDISR